MLHPACCLFGLVSQISTETPASQKLHSDRTLLPSPGRLVEPLLPAATVSFPSETWLARTRKTLNGHLNSFRSAQPGALGLHLPNLQKQETSRRLGTLETSSELCTEVQSAKLERNIRQWNPCRPGWALQTRRSTAPLAPRFGCPRCCGAVHCSKRVERGHCIITNHQVLPRNAPRRRPCINLDIHFQMGEDPETTFRSVNWTLLKTLYFMQ